MRTRLQSGPSGAAPTGWRFFPWYVAGGLCVVLLVNAVLVFLAVESFPGLATDHGFNASNHYDSVLAAADRQAALGWTVQDTLADGRPVVALSGRDGAPLAGARLSATAERPIGAAEPVPVAFHATAPGRFEADAPLEQGKWELDLTVTANGQDYHTVRRLIVK
jgi:nitrogen fixation protein FixH